MPGRWDFDGVEEESERFGFVEQGNLSGMTARAY